jgi:hypothetical protein
MVRTATDLTDSGEWIHASYQIDNGYVVGTTLHVNADDRDKWIKDLGTLGTLGRGDHGNMYVHLDTGLDYAVTVTEWGVDAAMRRADPDSDGGHAAFSTTFHGLPVVSSIKARTLIESLVQAKRMFRVEFYFPGMLPLRVSQTKEVLAAGMLEFDEGTLASVDLRMPIMSLGSGGWELVVKDAIGEGAPSKGASATSPAAVDAFVGSKEKDTHVQCRSSADVGAVHFRAPRYDRRFPVRGPERFVDSLPTTDPRELFKSVRAAVDKMPDKVRAKILANPLVIEDMQRLDSEPNSQSATALGNALMLNIMSILAVQL